jgi:hypothetical protein
MKLTLKHAFCAPAVLCLAACGGGDVSIGGTLSGLGSGQTVTLQNNGTDNLALSANGAFSFATPVSVSATSTTTTTAPYIVTVLTQPSGQTCSVTNASGTVSATTLAVTNVVVTCAAASSLGGIVTGLTAGTSVTLQNGSSTVAVASNGSFVIGGVLTAGSAYNLVVSVQPIGLNCVVTNPSGTVVANFTAMVPVTCTPS